MTATVMQLTLRVQRVRSATGPDCVFSGLALDSHGHVEPHAPRYAVSIPYALSSVPVEAGQWWKVSGRAVQVEYDVDGWRVRERRLVASGATLVRPSGEHIVRLLATSPDFPGIGEVKARHLWDALGEGLYERLEAGDHAELAAVIGEDLARVLLEGWKTFGNADALRFFQRIGLDLNVSRKVLAIYEEGTLDAIQEDPYRLLTFGMRWQEVDALAKSEFGVTEEDPRRLTAAVETALHTALDEGHTCLERSVAEASIGIFVGAARTADALRLAIDAHHVVEQGGRLHALGPWAIETAVASALRDRLVTNDALMKPRDVEALISDFEAQEARLSADGKFSLNEAQRGAVLAVAKRGLVLVTGGAGTGKTTVLKCIGRMLESAGQQTYQMALSGRAAKRMTDATGMPSATIAGFLRNIAKEGIPSNSTLLIDEASMLDILLAYRLLKAIPTSSRLILIGDPYQLPPVGPGLTLHALVGVHAVPRVELTEVRRFGGEIAEVAAEVRSGNLPALPSDSSQPIAFIDCPTDGIGGKLLEILRRDLRNTQILTFTRQRGPTSSDRLNAECQLEINGSASRLAVWSDERDRLEDTGLRLDDPVLCNRNLWGAGVQNGSLGRIHAIEAAPLQDPDGMKTYAWVRWDDGEIRPMTAEVLDALELGFAITVHKAQGSQFRRVLIPVSKARNLDRTMLYTALTRAVDQVIFVGSIAVCRQVVEAPPHASRRNVALGNLLHELMESCNGRGA